MNTLEKDLEENNFQNLYLFYGDENYLKNLYVDKFKSKIIDKTYELMNYEFYNDKSISIDTLMESIETMPFASDYRLIVVKDSNIFSDGNKKDNEKFAEYAKKIPQTSIVIFNETKVDKRLKPYKILSKIGRFVEFKIGDKTLLTKWIKDTFKNNNKLISQETISYFMNTVGYSMEELNLEIQKLVDYKYNDVEIKKDDIDTICTKSLEMKIFDLIKAMAYKNSALAIEIYNNLISYKNSPFMILSMISRQFRLILQAKYLNKKDKYAISDMANILQVRDFVIRECIEQGKFFTNKIILEALADCSKCDLDIKSGNIDSVNGVELILIKYSMK